MAVFLVEAYAADTSCRGLAEVADGLSVRYLRSIFVPEDETCFHLFEAPSADVVWDVSRRASLEPIRVVEAHQ